MGFKPRFSIPSRNYSEHLFESPNRNISSLFRSRVEG